MKITDRTEPKYIKLLYIGDSGSGKTGSLVSLLQAGYTLRILDMDNGLDALQYFTRKANPALLENIDVLTYRDKYVADPVRGLRVSGRAKAYTQALSALTKWDDESVPAEWGADTILVLDSLTAFGRAAFNWAQGMNPTVKDGRQWYGTAQESVRKVLELLTDDDFRCNVIVCSHIQTLTDEHGSITGTQINAIGKALGPDIPKFFNTLIGAMSRGSGDNVKRTIQTAPTNTIDYKLPAELEKTLPLETGLATVFKVLKATH